MSAEIAVTTPWMDRAWLQDVLRDSENDPSLSVIDYQVSIMGSKGDNYLSQMYRISVQLRRAGHKDQNMYLVAKTLPPGKEIRKILSKSSAYPNEISVFTDILPQFRALLEDVAPGSFQQFAAVHIYSEKDFPYCLVVTDLASEGFEPAERRQGLDLDHCLLVMRALARYHAVSVALHDSDPRLVESFKINIFSEDPPSEVPQGFAKPNIRSLAKVVRSWPEGGETMANKLLEIADTFGVRLRQQVLIKSNRLNVLLHGDLWPSNMLFKYNGGTGKVEDVRFVDLQLACYASCAIDLQYFIHSSPRDDVRIAHTEDILREYHSELCSTLELLGQAKKAITFQELLDEYEGKGVFGLLSSLLVLPVALTDSKDAADTEALMSGDCQLENCDKIILNEEYVKTMKRLLPVFERKGYF